MADINAYVVRVLRHDTGYTAVVAQTEIEPLAHVQLAESVACCASTQLSAILSAFIEADMPRLEDQRAS